VLYFCLQYLATRDLNEVVIVNNELGWMWEAAGVAY
jgi:hypothetical protein